MGLLVRRHTIPIWLLDRDKEDFAFSHHAFIEWCLEYSIVQEETQYVLHGSYISSENGLCLNY